ncbi:DNA recombination protein RmuC [Algihabitans albus]|uniref:DNA recombination protein RmuC n=1 Tax=Algihabitans albus TaxID=2164067 RepID=UPI0013C35F98|nr:DNA recombination protein RmuC [Algihabitans albus]
MPLSPELLLAGFALLLVLLLAVAVLRRPKGEDAKADRAAEAIALQARLTAMAESQAATQAQIAEALRSQERQLAEAMDLRLGNFTQRVGERLNEQTRTQSTAMTDLRERLAVIDRAQKNITELSTQVVGLQDILSNKQARGAFGEVQLKDLVQSALPPSAYDFQATLANGRRADCLIKLPNPPGPIAIDAKFPLESYQALRQAEEDSARLAAQRAFATDLRKHVRDIAERYIVPGETAESALLFLPSEAVYAELHANFANVVEESYRARVWIVSPTTMMATLNTVRAVLRDVRMREQASVIQTEVQTMLEDVTRLDQRVGKLETHFDQASRDIRDIRISADKVTKRGERIKDLELEDEGAAGQIADTVAPPARPRLVE